MSTMQRGIVSGPAPLQQLVRQAAAPRPLRAVAVAAAAGGRPACWAQPQRCVHLQPQLRLWPALQLRQQQQQQHPKRAVAAAAGEGEGSGASGGDASGGLINAALLALWAGLMGYVLFLAPNQTPTIDAFTVQKLVGLKQDDPFQVNAVFSALFNAMGLYPLIYAALLIPAARSNKLPAWPFVSASVFLGAYALIPYMALWSPKTPPEQLPPPKEELEGWNKLYMKGAETAVLPALLSAGAALYVFQMATAGGTAWADFLRLFDQSRLVHATTLDFTLCTLLAPFWMSNDAEGRKWEQRGTLVPLLSLLPLVGAAIYLLLRPKTDLSKPAA